MPTDLGRSVGSRLKTRRAGDRILRRNPLFYPGARRLFDRLESASLDERTSWTAARLRSVLRVASTTAYGRGVRSDRLADWPLLDKEAVRDAPDAFVRGRKRFASRASTSGTTGTPLRLVRSLRSIAVEQAAIDRLALAKGVDLSTRRVAVLRGDDLPDEPGMRLWRDDVGGRRRTFASNRLSPETVDAFVDALEAFAPDCLLAYPTVLESLARFVDHSGRDLGIPLTITSSEVLTAAVRRYAETMLRTQVIDYYGQAERVSFAYSFAPDAYTFLCGYGVTELVPVREDDDGDVFEIVGTPLWNLAMPLVRYRTGDLVVLPKGTSAGALEEVCNGIRPVTAIVGRADDVLVAPSGVRLVGIDHIPRDVDNVLRIQLVQEAPDFVRILILPKPGFDDANREQVASNARRKLAPGMRYSLEVVESLERTPNGKVPLVIRRPAADVASAAQGVRPSSR